MRWWGWGEDEHAIELPPAAQALLGEELGATLDERRGRVELDVIALPEPGLPKAARSAIADRRGGGRAARRSCGARGARARQELSGPRPDPLRRRLERAGRRCGARLGRCRSRRAERLRGRRRGGDAVRRRHERRRGRRAAARRHSAAISLDLSRLDRLVAVDPVSLTVTLEPGIFGPELERRLEEQGLTLGHFPQSFEFSTVGGWVATRSAGQASTGYGRIDELVEAVRCETPAGALSTRDVPATAAGPSLRELIVGSEGTLGVITSATLRVRPLPEARHYEGWSFNSFEEGTDALRLLEQDGASPDVARLSDEEETRLTMSLSSTGGTSERIGRAYLRARGHEHGCLAFTGFDGTDEALGRRRGRAAELLRAAGAIPLGQRPGRSWLRGRFAAPYLRDDMLDRGVMVETLETATTWSSLHALYAAVGAALREALAARGTPPAVMCHVSHLYPSGASLYFTFIARQEAGAELEQWRAAKSAACDAIEANGGTITHHHAIGRDHAPWMEDEVGPLGLDVLRATKAQLDPAGIMNPGKLIPA